MLTLHRQLGVIIVLILSLVISGCTQVHAQTLAKPNVMQVQIGNGFVRQVEVGEPSASCTGGTELNLTQTGSDLLSGGYHFAKTHHTIAPSIREIDGVEQVYLLTLGQTGEYLVFWPNDQEGISATQMSANVPTPLLSIPPIYQSWKSTVSMNGARVTMVNGDTTLWLTRVGNYFCAELQTPMSANDSGNLHFFATNGRLPVGNEIEVFVDN